MQPRSLALKWFYHWTMLNKKYTKFILKIARWVKRIMISIYTARWIYGDALLYFIGYSLWTLKFPWVSTLYLSIFYYHCKHNYHSIFILKMIDRFCYWLVKMLVFAVFSHHTNPETDDCASLLIKVYYSTLMLLLSNNINASPAARGIFLTCNNTMRSISLQWLTLLQFIQTVHSLP